MHELGVVFRVIRQVEEIAAENDVTRVESVTLSLGEVSSVIPEYLIDCWKWAVKRTEVMREAELKIEPIPAITHCDACGTVNFTLYAGHPELDGITFRFIDTAGIRHTDDQIELMGIDRSIAAAQRAQIILMMTEPGVPYPDIPVRDDQIVIRIENKTETFQAKFGVGLDTLRQRLLDAAPKTADNDFIVTNARHYEALIRASEHLQRVLDGLGAANSQLSIPNSQLPPDLVAEDLRLTLDTLAEITGGQITPQETLNNIFKNFCVGK